MMGLDRYNLPQFCYDCSQPYPWMEHRLETARDLLENDDELNPDDRENLWSLLQYVMSYPTSDLVPAKRKLIEINLAKAGATTRDMVIDFLAKVPLKCQSRDEKP